MVNTSDCGSDIRGFDSPHSPIFLGYSQAVRQGTLTPSCVGSNPATPVILCRRGGIGRRAGLKIQCPQGRAGSTPAAGISYTPLGVFFLSIGVLIFMSDKFQLLLKQIRFPEEHDAF